MVEQLTSDFTSELARSCTDWCLDSTARETQLRVQAAIDLATVRERYASELAQLHEDHDKELRDLQALNAESMNAVMRELEAKRVGEIATLKGMHESEMEVARDKAARKEAETVLHLNMEKMAEMKEVKEEFGRQLKEREEEIEKLRTAELDHVVSVARRTPETRS